MVWYRYTRTPRESAAKGFSPADRRRRPNGVRHSSQAVNGTRAMASTTSSGMFVVRPRSAPARSDTYHQSLSWTQPRKLGVVQPKRSPPDKNGTVTSGTSPLTDGEVLIDPPPTADSLAGWANVFDERYRVIPGARMLIATPDTMWSTPKPTVAMAWSMPPSAPPTMPKARPAHGPHWMPPHAADQVPSVIIPSRPMLTIPARSQYRPPRPASRIGEPRISIAVYVPGWVSAIASNWLERMTRTRKASSRTAIGNHRSRINRR